MMEVLSVVAIIVAGLMVGCELAIAVFVHPTLDKLPDDVHLPAASALARVQGRFMPFWYILVFLLTPLPLQPRGGGLADAGSDPGDDDGTLLGHAIVREFKVGRSIKRRPTGRVS